MRVTNHHKKALERQVLESIRIEEGNLVQEESLNLKSEWVSSKLPGMQVQSPKGIRKPERKEGKRVRYEKEEEGTLQEGENWQEGTQEVGNSQGRQQKRPRNSNDREEGRKLVIEVRKDVQTREEMEKEKIEKERKKKLQPQSFTEIQLRKAGHSWSP